MPPKPCQDKLPMVRSVEFALLNREQLNWPTVQTHLNDALARVPGIEEIRANATQRRIWISFNSALIDEATLGEKLVELGYRVRPL